MVFAGCLRYPGPGKFPDGSCSTQSPWATCTHTARELQDSVTHLKTDVLVIGGGLAGLAATIHLKKAGLDVACLEPRENFTASVGESLDWSAPALLEQLGLSMEMLVRGGAATLKRHVQIISLGGVQQDYRPVAWVGGSPWNVELRTLHLD